MNFLDEEEQEEQEQSTKQKVNRKQQYRDKEIEDELAGQATSESSSSNSEKSKKEKPKNPSPMLIVLPSDSEEDDDKSDTTEKTSITKARRKKDLAIIERINDPDLESHGEESFVKAIAINQREDGGSTTSSITIGDETEDTTYDNDVPLTHLDSKSYEGNDNVSTSSIKSIDTAHIKALFTKEMTIEEKQAKAKAHMSHMIRKLITKQSKVVEKAIEDERKDQTYNGMAQDKINIMHSKGIDVRKYRPQANTTTNYAQPNKSTEQPKSILRSSSYNSPTNKNTTTSKKEPNKQALYHIQIISNILREKILSNPIKPASSSITGSQK